MSFPLSRPRRLRRTEALRAMVRETELSPARLVLPLSAIFGAVLMAGADLAARLAGDIPVGVVTAIIGAPFFLVLLRRTRAGYEL